MPTLAQQKDAAIAEIRRHARFDLPPALTAEDWVGDDFDRYRRATLWTASTAYSYGDVILPTVRNGHRYRCIVAGTSGATEPTWVLSAGFTVSEGSSTPLLRWVEDGTDYNNVYDVRRALYDIWNAKAEAAASLYQVRLGGQFDHAQQQIYEHCVKEREKYALISVS